MKGITIINVTADNVAEVGIYCIRDKNSPGYKAKLLWYKNELQNGLQMRIAADMAGKQLGFIEFIPSEYAWRPVKAKNFYFIQCIAVFGKQAREKGLGGYLLELCEAEAIANGKAGICAMSSNGAWMAEQSLYEKNGFLVADNLGRFELMVKALSKNTTLPSFFNWQQQCKKYKGWHLLYADQCPWHQKSVTDLAQCASDKGVRLQLKKLTTAFEAQKAPSGFGTFSLIKDGVVLADHYLSKTRFQNILRQEGVM